MAKAKILIKNKENDLESSHYVDLEDTKMKSDKEIFEKIGIEDKKKYQIISVDIVEDNDETINQNPKFSIINNVNQEQIKHNIQYIEVNELTIKLFEKKLKNKLEKIDKLISKTKDKHEKHDYEEKRLEILNKYNSKIDIYKKENKALLDFNEKNSNNIENHIKRMELFSLLLANKSVKYTHKIPTKVLVSFFGVVPNKNKLTLSKIENEMEFNIKDDVINVKQEGFDVKLKYDAITDVCIYFYSDLIVIDFNKSLLRMSKLNGTKIKINKLAPKFFYIVLKNTNEALSIVSELTEKLK